MERKREERPTSEEREYEVSVSLKVIHLSPERKSGIQDEDLWMGFLSVSLLRTVLKIRHNLTDTKNLGTKVMLGGPDEIQAHW